MSKPFKPVILTANHLLTGAVVYFDFQGNWTQEFRAAQVFHDKEQAEYALAAILPSEVVGAYLAPININAQTYIPDHFRERFRANGPSISYQ